GDIFLQVVESKNRDGADQDRHQIAVFAEDMQKFLQGLEKSLSFIEKEQKNRAKIKAEKKAAKIEKAKKIYKIKEKQDDGIKRTGRIHVVSKRLQNPQEE
ncbi:MAG: DUF3276 family protein, partial [Treponema sp.]|nr:DUF3276 family protein [Treponema sp.]